MNFIEKHIGGLCAMEQRVLLMVNPMAGRQKIRNELLYVVDTLTKAGYETIIYTTQGKDATRDLLAEKDSLTELFAAAEMAPLMRFCRQRCIGISALFWGIFLQEPPMILQQV